MQDCVLYSLSGLALGSALPLPGGKVATHLHLAQTLGQSRAVPLRPPVPSGRIARDLCVVNLWAVEQTVLNL